jgi:hypothetical protein
MQVRFRSPFASWIRRLRLKHASVSQIRSLTLAMMLSRQLTAQ